MQTPKSKFRIYWDNGKPMYFPINFAALNSLHIDFMKVVSFTDQFSNKVLTAYM